MLQIGALVGMRGSIGAREDNAASLHAVLQRLQLVPDRLMLLSVHMCSASTKVTTPLSTAVACRYQHLPS